MQLISYESEPGAKVGIHTYLVATLLVIVAGIFIAYLVASSRNAENEHHVQQVLQDESRAVEAAVQNRFRIYEEILLSGATLFRITGNVDRQQWKEFTEGLSIQQRYPGTLGVGYASQVGGSSLDAHTAQIRHEGFAEYAVYPHGERPLYTPILYLEPFTGVNIRALGYDMYSEPARKEAIDLARDTGRPALSGQSTLVQDDGRSSRAGVLLYMPVYRQGTRPTNTTERQRDILGYTYMPLRMHELIPGLLADKTEDNRYGFAIKDTQAGPTGESLYESPQYKAVAASRNMQQKTTNIQLFNRQWQLHLLADSSQLVDMTISPWVIFWTGAFFSCVVGALLFVLMMNRLGRLAFIHEKEVQRTKDELLALASHQLRTPASGVKQYIGMVLEGYAGKTRPEQHKMLQKAYIANERQLEIINQLLYVAKADAGQLTVEKTPFSLDGLTRDVLDSFGDQLRQKDLRVEVKKLPKVEVVSDERYVRMIIENIISNAMKYTPAGGNIIIGLERGITEAELAISDDGVGIAREDHSRLFQKFSRIQNALSREAGGSGIGLYLSKQLAERLGGDIVCVSAPGQGSVFTLKLPYKPVKSENDYRTFMGRSVLSKKIFKDTRE